MNVAVVVVVEEKSKTYKMPQISYAAGPPIN